MSLMFVASVMMAQAPVTTPPAPPQATSVAAQPEKEKKICKVDENESSSRLRRRVCMTETEWQQKEAGKDLTDIKSMGQH